MCTFFYQHNSHHVYVFSLNFDQHRAHNMLYIQQHSGANGCLGEIAPSRVVKEYKPEPGVAPNKIVQWSMKPCVTGLLQTRVTAYVKQRSLLQVGMVLGIVCYLCRNRNS